MRKLLSSNLTKMLITGTILMQTGGCDLGMINSIIQTIFLGITAAGSVVLIREL